MKFFGLFAQWTGWISAGLLCATVSLIQADPTDDFSFSLAHPPESQAYRLISEFKVDEILYDHIKDFPTADVPKLSRHLVELCRRYRFDPVFVLSLIKVESGFRTQVLSPVGARGLMQLMPATAFAVAKNWNLKLPGQPDFVEYDAQAKKYLERALMNPYHNLSLGVAYLAYLRDRYAGVSPYFLVAAYNVGPSRMDELLARKDFRPVQTKQYYENIRKVLPQMRDYRRQARREVAGRKLSSIISRSSGA